jgi:hypothetical protein
VEVEEEEEEEGGEREGGREGGRRGEEEGEEERKRGRSRRMLVWGIVYRQCTWVDWDYRRVVRYEWDRIVKLLTIQ